MKLIASTRIAGMMFRGCHHFGQQEQAGRPKRRYWQHPIPRSNGAKLPKPVLPHGNAMHLMMNPLAAAGLKAANLVSKARFIMIVNKTCFNKQTSHR